MNQRLIRPNDRLPVEHYPEWLQTEVAERRTARRWTWLAIPAVPAIGAAIGAAFALIAR